MDRLEALRSFERMITGDEGWGDLEGEHEHGLSIITLLSPDNLSDQNAHWAHRAYFGSLDAAKALHEAVLPEYGIQITTYDEDEGNFEVSVSRHDQVKTYDALDHGMARAWLQAITRALIGQQEATMTDTVTKDVRLKLDDDVVVTDEMVEALACHLFIEEAEDDCDPDEDLKRSWSRCSSNAQDAFKARARRLMSGDFLSALPTPPQALSKRDGEVLALKEALGSMLKVKMYGEHGGPLTSLQSQYEDGTTGNHINQTVVKRAADVFTSTSQAAQSIEERMAERARADEREKCASELEGLAKVLREGANPAHKIHIEVLEERASAIRSQGEI